jgi:hypothetical protein
MIFILGLCSSLGAFPQSPDLLSRAQGVSSVREGTAFVDELQGTSDPLKNLYLGIAYQRMALQDPDHYVETARRMLAPVYDSTRLPLALGYLGSVIALQSMLDAHAGRLLRAFASYSDGLAKIDEAIREAPASIDLRFLRVETNLGISEGSPFNRSAFVEADLDFLGPMTASMSDSDRSLYSRCRDRLAAIGNRRK